MQVRANCKVNVGLRVRRRREDGYHEIETLFYPVYGLYDVLDIELADEASSGTNEPHILLTTSGIDVDCTTGENLIAKAYYRMASLYEKVGSVRVHIDKRIPYGAGLGGGSSDAAHTVMAINELFALGLTREQMADAVRPIGADCPFFLYNTPCLASGIGDVIEPTRFSWQGKRMVMLKPSVSVSTKEAYGGIHLHDEPLDLRVNDFEETVFARYPILGRAKHALQDAGAEYAAMSGSGSVIYGVFEQNTERGSLPLDRLIDKEFASMVIFDDTL